MHCSSAIGAINRGLCHPAAAIPELCMTPANSVHRHASSLHFAKTNEEDLEVRTRICRWTNMRAIEDVRIIATVLDGNAEREVGHGLTLNILLTPTTAVPISAERDSVSFLFVQQQAFSST